MLGGSVSSASRARTRLNIAGRSRWAMSGLETRLESVLQVKLGFTVKASTDSTTDLAKKNRGSVQSITKVREGELKG